VALTSSGKPTYLGLLNTVSLAETRAHCYLTEWASVTKSEEVRQVLLTVAAREGEHGMSFAKRINELGYRLRTKPDDRSDQALEIVRADCSDLEKFEALGLQKLDTGDEPDVFDDLFKDHTIDIRTGEMLGRYIAEERDSARLFRSCYEQLCAAAANDTEAKSRKGAKGAGDKAAEKAAKQLVALDTKVDALTRAVEELRQIVCAQSMPASAG
jgi:rubrerythrin